MTKFRKKEPQSQEPMDLDSVMKKYDRESNTRVWEGKPKIAVTCLLALFSVFCLYVTLFASWLEEWRLTTFVAGIVFLGYLVYPAKKGTQRVNYIPWYDIVMMVLGTGSFLYFSFNAIDIIQQGSNLAWYQMVIGIVAIQVKDAVDRISFIYNSVINSDAARILGQGGSCHRQHQNQCQQQGYEFLHG